ncbi:MAG: UDP-2,3-diacylglucosamine diphosphatase [Gammaproteobacteria bacterium]
MAPQIRTKQLFISDLHLCADRPAISELFLRFIDRDVAQCAALYILGDLFEVWLGDDDTDPESCHVLTALRRLADSGVKTYFMHGNRDFLVGARFANISGCHLLPDPCVISLNGQATLLMHGDTLCTQDIDYQNVRRQIRTPDWTQAFLALPLAQRARLAKQYREESLKKTSGKSELIMDVDQTAVETVMRQYQVTRLIHGHTHRPAVHDFYLDGQPAQRIVLGDWYEQGSALWCDADGCELIQLPINGQH